MPSPYQTWILRKHTTTLLLLFLTLTSIFCCFKRLPISAEQRWDARERLSNLRKSKHFKALPTRDSHTALYRTVSQPGNCSQAIALVAELVMGKQPVFIPGGARELLSLNPQIFMEEAVTLPGFSGMVVVSPNSTFSLFNNSTRYMELAASDEGRLLLPNRLQTMTFSEFWRRSHGELPPLFWPEHEEYNWQSAAPEASLRQLLELPMMQCWQRYKTGPRRVSARSAEDKRVRFYEPMLRVSPSGAMHSMHYDASHSMILQLTGTKNVILVPAHQLEWLYPAHSDFLQRRTHFSVDMFANPDYDRFPLAKQLTPMVVTCRPGDMLLFPSRTGHATESVTDQSSLSFRLIEA